MGSPFPRRAHRLPAYLLREAAMTVYVSRNATTGEPWRPEPPKHAGLLELERITEPSLLTHLWRQHFERQARQEIRR